MTKRRWEDAFNMLCGDKIGAGIHRTVFVNNFDSTKVVKVEHDVDVYRYFANVHECKFHGDNKAHWPVARWLAPVHSMSANGFILIQSRTEPIRASDKLPARLPAFLTDIKRANFGWLNGRLVCHDYALVKNTDVTLRKVDWREESE